MHRRKSKNPAANRLAPPGFTLVELIVVVIIVAIIAMVVIPQLTGASSLRARSAARVLVADLEYAQSQAIATQTNVTVTFSISGNSYSVSNGSGTLIHPITKKVYAVDFDVLSGFDGVSIAAASFGGAPTVTFDSLGAPASNGTVDTVAGEHTYRVTVAPVTGRVSVAKVP